MAHPYRTMARRSTWGVTRWGRRYVLWRRLLRSMVHRGCLVLLAPAFVLAAVSGGLARLCEPRLWCDLGVHAYVDAWTRLVPDRTGFLEAVFCRRCVRCGRRRLDIY